MVLPQAVPVTAPVRQVLFPKAEGYGALIDDYWVRLATNRELPVRFYTRDALAQRQDDTGSVYDNVLDLGYAFSRSDVSGGEGLDWFPRNISQLNDNEVLDRIRYFDSENIEIRRPQRGEKTRIELSRAVKMWSSGQFYQDMTTSDRYLHIAYGNTVEEWSDWDAGAPATSYNTSADVLQIEASPTGDLMALLNTGTIEYVPNGTSTPQAVPTLASVKQIWYAKGRFIAEVPNGDRFELQEFDEAGPIGSPFDIYRGNCESLVSSGPAVVAAISDGTLRTYVSEQANQIDSTSVNLVIRGRTETPEGEVPYLLGSNADVLLILTKTTGTASDNNIRLYQAEVLDARFDYSVGQLQLKREWLNAPVVDEIRENMAYTRDEIWFEIPEEAGFTMLWRFDLVTNGISRQYRDTANNTYSLVAFDRRLGYIHDDEFIYRSSDEYADEGWLITPNVTFGVNTDISFLALALTAEDLVGTGKQVEIYYSTKADAILDKDDPSWVLGLRASAQPQAEIEALLAKVEGRQIALQLRLFSHSAGAGTPRVNNFAVRGIPNQRDWIMEIPVNVSDYIEVPGRKPVHIPQYGYVVHRQMLGLAGKAIEAIVLDPPMAIRGIVDNIIEPTEYVSDRGAVSVRCVMQIRGERLTTTVNPVGDSGLGLGQLGVSTLGIGQTIRT